MALTPLAVTGIVFLVAYLVFAFQGLHQVREGHVGVYWRGGALLRTITGPGYHLKMPFITTFAEVQTSLQTDSVSRIACGTSGGVLITFDSIEVVNRLNEEYVFDTVRNYTLNYDKPMIFDRIHSEINQICSQRSLHEVYISLFSELDELLAETLQSQMQEWAPGIEIIAVRVTKPVIPDSIAKNFEKQEVERTKLLIATEHQKVVEREAETERMRATIEAQMKLNVSSILMEKELKEKETAKKISAMEDEILAHRSKAMADAEHYKAVKEAEANEQLLTDEYIEYTRILSLANNTKVYFGEAIPSVFVDQTQYKNNPQLNTP